MTLPKPGNDVSDNLHSPGVDPDRISSSRISQRRLARALDDGLQFGKYRVVRLIAIGGMSEIYEAIHLGLKKSVALKVMRSDLAQTAEARQRFIAEGINAARLRHTNVVDVTDVGEIDELPYLVMNLLEGEDLGRLIDRERRIPIPEIVDLLLPVASAIALGHERGVVHRDLKPDNIFLHREGTRVIPKVLDFGVSRVMDARRITLNASVFGTPHYMSPEQARGGPTDARTDQYSLGVILYEAITGQLPRDSANPLELLHAVAYDSFRPPSDYRELPEGLEAAILRAMAHDPNDRFPSLRDLALALVPFASDSAREYWTVELEQPAGRISETRVPEAVRHPSPIPAAVAERPPAPEFAFSPTPAELPSRTSSHPAHTHLTELTRPAPLAPLHIDPVDHTGPIRKYATRPTRPPTHSPRVPAVQILPTSEVQPRALEPSAPPAISSRDPHTKRARAAAWLIVLVVPIAIAGGTWAWQHNLPREEPITATPPKRVGYFDVEVRSDPSDAVLSLDGKIVATGHYTGRLPRDGAPHELRATAVGWNPATVRFRDAAPPSQIALEREAPPKPATVALASTAPPHRVTPMAARHPRPLPRMAAQRVASPLAAGPQAPRSPPEPPNPASSNAAQEPVPLVAAPTPEHTPAPTSEQPRPKVRLVGEDEPSIEVVE